MRAGLSQVREWFPGRAGDASEAVVVAAREFRAAMDEVGRAVDQAMAQWRGAAATAASLRALESQLAANHIGAAVVDIADALADAAGLSEVCALVRGIEAEAVAGGCVVEEDGTVVPPRVQTGNAAADLTLQWHFDETAATLQARLVPLLETAGDTDREVGERLAAGVTALGELAGAPQGGTLRRRVVGILDGTDMLPEDPKALCAFWETLSPAEQDALFAFDPGIGNRDGIPVVTRDYYNRADLERLRAAAAGDLAALDAQHPGWASREELPDTVREWNHLQRWESQRVELRTRLADYQAVASEIGADAGSRYLLAVDDRGRGAIAVNNPDAARNIATFVPGTDSPLRNIGWGTARAAALVSAAGRADASARTAAVAWYGYQAPPDLAAATQDRYADDGAPLLDRFQDGLRATHDGAPSHNTVVGHSYGTTVIGVAAESGSLAADAVVFAGSPGVEAERVTELHLDGVASERMHERVFATADPGDPIPVLGPFAHGPDPAGPDFGARVFESAAPTLDLPLLRGVPLDPWVHGRYWESGNPGLYTQGRIIAGTYDR